MVVARIRDPQTGRFIGARKDLLMTSAYAAASHVEIAGARGALQHFRDFIASPIDRMRDPFDGEALTHDHARQRLHWLLRVAILRKAKWIEDRHSREHAPALNHRGAFPRFRTGDAQRHLLQLAARLNTPRLIVRESELGEWKAYLMRRIPRRITRRDEEES